MALKSDITLDFVNAILENEKQLSMLNFEIGKFRYRGYACFIDFSKSDNTKVEFMIGPSDWVIEMIVQTPKGKFNFKDLLEISYIRNWVKLNQYCQGKDRNLKNEVKWFINLLKISIPIV